MRQRLFFIILLALSFNNSCFAQYMVTSIYNQLRTDSMLKYTIDYFPPGYGGENRLWDFSRYASAGKCRIVYYDRDSSNVITMRDGNQSLHLYQRQDTLYSFYRLSYER